MISEQGIDLIIGFEVSSPEYYTKHLQTPEVPCWQTTSSGVTIGIGFDLGANTPNQIEREWAEYLTPDDIQKLKSVSGYKGTVAHNYLYRVKGVVIPWTIARNHFGKYTIPRYFKTACDTYPGLINSPVVVQDVITSIIFNRGSSLEGSRRTEMLAIKSLIERKRYDLIPEQIRKMKRLWIGSVQGLVDRRESESKYLENGLRN